MTEGFWMERVEKKRGGKGSKLMATLPFSSSMGDALISDQN